MFQSNDSGSLRNLFPSTLLLVSVFSLFVCSRVVAQLPTIEVHSLSQSAAQIGSQLKLIPQGNQLDELQSLLSTNTAVVGVANQPNTKRLLASEEFEANFGDGSFEVDVGTNGKTGLCEIRFRGRFGVSNPRRFLLTNSKVKSLVAEKSQGEDSVELHPGVIWTTKCSSKAYQSLNIPVQEGDLLRIVAYAKPIDSQAIPALIALDSEGNELAKSRAIQDWPAEIDLVAPDSSPINLKLYDFLFRGGEEFECLLEIAIVPANQESQPETELDRLLRPSFSDSGVDRLVSVDPARLGSPVISQHGLRDSALAQSSDSPPVPVSRNGNFLENNPVLFEAQKGQKLSISVISSQLGQLTDPYFVIFKQSDERENNALAFLDDMASFGGPEMRIRNRDPALTWTAPESAAYQLQLFDNNQGQRPSDSLQYCVHISDPAPSVAILAYPGFPNNNRAIARPMGSSLMRGGTQEIRLLVHRSGGFSSAIQIAARNLPAGVTSIPAVIPSSSREGSLILEASEDAASSAVPIVLDVTPLDGEEKELATRKLTGVVATAANPTRNSIYSRLCYELIVSVNDADIAPVFVTPVSNEPTRGKQKSSLEIPIRVVRRNGVKNECLLRAKDLPPNCSCADVKIKGDAEEGKITLKISEKTPPGTYTFWLQNETKIKWAPNPQALEREQKYLTALKSPEVTLDKQMLSKEIAAVEKSITELKKKHSARDYTVWLPSRLIQVTVLAAD